jgi:hypothetical protein
MNKWLLGLIGLALLEGGPLFAQSPAVTTNVHNGSPMSATMGACRQDSGACTRDQITCAPQSYIKKVTKTIYSSGCEPLCMPSCGLLRLCGCDFGHCEHPYTRRYLLKKTITCEEEAVKCVPSCQSGAYGCASQCSGQSTGPKRK